jgi:hypothetical protein
MKLLPRLRPALRRVIAHAGLAFALLFAQMGLVNHFYTAHTLDSGAAELAVKLKVQHGGQASELCHLCLAYSIFGGTAPVEYGSSAVPTPATAISLPRAHRAPFYSFVSYASRAPPGLSA